MANSGHHDQPKIMDEKLEDIIIKILSQTVPKLRTSQNKPNNKKYKLTKEWTQNYLITAWKS